MAHPFARNHVHLVFSTKERRPLIKPALRDELYSYLRRVATDYGISIDLIGGTDDHVHILLDLPPKIALSSLVCALKAKSSKWMNEEGHLFAWQNSYGCFSVSTSHLPQVKAYLAHQEEHHRRRDFLAEFSALLRRHGIKTRAEEMFVEFEKPAALPPFGLAFLIALIPGARAPGCYARARFALGLMGLIGCGLRNPLKTFRPPEPPKIPGSAGTLSYWKNSVILPPLAPAPGTVVKRSARPMSPSMS